MGTTLDARNAPVVLLEEKGGARALPIWIGTAEFIYSSASEVPVALDIEALREIASRPAEASFFMLDAAPGSDPDELAQRLKLSLWQRGVLECGADGCGASSAELPRLAATWLSQQHLPIVRLRGGADGCGGTSCEPPSANLDALRAELGEEFAAALDQNEADHLDDCAASCESFYCGPGAQLPAGAAEARSHSMGSVPPEDCAPPQALFSLAAWSRTRLCLQSRTSPTPSSSRSI